MGLPDRPSWEHGFPRCLCCFQAVLCKGSQLWLTGPDWSNLTLQGLWTGIMDRNNWLFPTTPFPSLSHPGVVNTGVGQRSPLRAWVPSICFCVVLLSLQPPVLPARWRAAGPNLTLQTEKKLHFWGSCQFIFDKIMLKRWESLSAVVWLSFVYVWKCFLYMYCITVILEKISSVSFLHMTFLQTTFQNLYMHPFKIFVISQFPEPKDCTDGSWSSKHLLLFGSVQLLLPFLIP